MEEVKGVPMLPSARWEVMKYFRQYMEVSSTADDNVLARELLRLSSGSTHGYTMVCDAGLQHRHLSP